jgi:16S rRNA (cytosine1402-N4)-methyltransferase
MYKGRKEERVEFRHTSVLLFEAVESLQVSPDGIYVDGTLGGGGHSYEIAKRLSKGGRLIGIDQDDAAIEAAGKRLREFEDKVTIIRANYAQMGEKLGEIGVSSVDGILLDLGVSSNQLDDARRGFTYREEDAPLDMRMDTRQELTAREVVNSWSVEQLTRILREYGEEKYAVRIARKIEERRRQRPIETTGELTAIVKAAIPAKERAVGRHPARRTFQAIRIEVNRELQVLEGSLNEMISLLNPGGRICIITFHSLEDRIVKDTFRNAEHPCICPPDFPVCVCGRKSLGRVVTRKPILPGEEEREHNPRSKSAKMRVFEKREAQENATK